MMNFDKISRLKVYCFLIIISSTLRFPGITHESLWNDELSSWQRSSYSSLEDVVKKGVCTDIHPPGYQILFYFIENTIGTSETSLRTPSAIAGVITVLLVYEIGAMIFRRDTALLGAVLLSISTVHIWLSQEARPYSLLIMTVCLSVFLMLRLFRKQNGRAPLVAALTVSFIFLEYLHYFGLLFFALSSGVILVLVLRSGKNLLPVLPAVIIPALAYIPWIPEMLRQSAGGSYINTPSIKSPVYLFIEYMGWSKPLLGVLAALTVLLLAGLVRKRINWCGGLSIILLWIALPVFAGLLISIMFVPVFTARSLMIALPAVLLFEAFCVRNCFSAGVTRRIAAVSLMGFMLMHLFFIRKHYTEPHRSQFREAAAYAAEHCDPDGCVLMASSWNPAYFNYYLSGTDDHLSVDAEAVTQEDWPFLKELLEENPSKEVWLLWAHVEPEEDLLDSISSAFDESSYTAFCDAGVWHYSKTI